jgi:ABC-type methionine transport system permease subunit
MRFLFVPFSIAAGVIAGFLSKKLFEAVWGVIDDEEPPDSEHRDIDLKKLLLAEALQGAIFSATRKLVDWEARKAFAGAVGVWPGKERPEPE